MSLPLRITFKDNDFVYQVLNSASLNKASRELEILVNQEKIAIVKDANERWIQSGGECLLDPDFVQAIGRSVALRFRM